MAHDTFKGGDLTAVIGDNQAHDKHLAGYKLAFLMKERIPGARWHHGETGQCL